LGAERDDARSDGLLALGRAIAVRVGDELAARVEHADACACRTCSAAEHALELGSELGGLHRARLEQRAHEGRLVAHVALERSEQLPLVDARELDACDGHEQHDHVEREKPRADTAREAPEGGDGAAQPSPAR
jgi:hypothetical protein